MKIRAEPQGSYFLLPICAGATGKNGYKKYSQRKQRFRLHGCSEGDTIFLLKTGISSEIPYRSSVTSTGAVFYII